MPCPAGYFEEDGNCYVQTQQLANTQGGGVFTAPTQYYAGIYGPSVSPVGIGPLNLQPLDPAVRQAIQAAGHTIDCRRECDEQCMGGPFAGDQCCSELCSVDGGPYERGAYAINASPGTLLVELGAGTPLFPAGGVSETTEPAKIGSEMTGDQPRLSTTPSAPTAPTVAASSQFGLPADVRVVATHVDPTDLTPATISTRVSDAGRDTPIMVPETQTRSGFVFGLIVAAIIAIIVTR